MTWALATASRSFTIVWTSINTLKTLKRVSKTDQGATVNEYKKNVQVCADVLTIWTVFGCIVVWETYLEFLVVWIPGYYYAKSFILIISSFPTIRVSNLAFYYAVVPMLDAVNDCIGSHYMPSSPLALLRVLPLLVISVLFPHLISADEDYLDTASSGYELSRADAVFERIRAKRSYTLSKSGEVEVAEGVSMGAMRTRRVSKTRSSLSEPGPKEAPSFSADEARASEVDEQFPLIPDYRDSFSPVRDTSASVSSASGAQGAGTCDHVSTNIAAESSSVMPENNPLDEEDQLVYVDDDQVASTHEEKATLGRTEGDTEGLSSGLDDADGIGGQWDWVVSSSTIGEQSPFSQADDLGARTKSRDRDATAAVAWTSAESVCKSLEPASPPLSAQVEEEGLSAVISVPRRFTSGSIKVSTSQANLLRGSGRRLSALAEIYPAITHAAASHSSSHHRSVGATSEGRSLYSSPEAAASVRSRRSIISISPYRASDELSGGEGIMSPLHNGTGSSLQGATLSESTPTKTPSTSLTPPNDDRLRTPVSASSLSSLSPLTSRSSQGSADENRDPAGEGHAASNPSQFVSTVRSLWTGDSKLSIRDTIRSTLDLHMPSPNSVIRSRRTMDYLRLSQNFGKAVLGSDSPRPLTSPSSGKVGSSVSHTPAPSAVKAAPEAKGSGPKQPSLRSSSASQASSGQQPAVVRSMKWK